ncbi:MAG TPA: bifunctional diaminohydroxyphosphoribosylaminopyrimidine deaminase/5-amino-6-(5-phosphoribosylamino)uracil reductase RibD [Niabella sp.]|nr:bifunctional diaminohydroxyphosphoribosylaminopyrimidine deaminase/5-amino-6-(5-phosphoribosylamino)uracil reductase RibD [Niabella sp.]HQW15121.1 bifunctional diaminohydroxyphosphoribosylaminopyrimidine deaminase/5-amino-6-(5-phosphoribosylamino)uracil reductase RibD [Niabella sp.]HQX20262.1 bifunctional diaminohydroxyphosphoribosylaminopyrimidine deaminase/5-amino-6-(5-phosphoribosylamino)uracil reductase RibD [Niabella sp.]HQX41587.1 bifunctional diaminohydroxyphosphoribosylaminopyrimidine
MQKTEEAIFMQRCFQLAKLGTGLAAPNPMVGAVLVHEGRIIGEGFHQKCGGPHAEVNCIEDAAKFHADEISKATIYVSLEPCAHFGKTPPCADLIIKHQIARVVIGCKDSFEKVAGKGIEKLKAAGVAVVSGILEPQAIALNKAFFTFHQKRRPYIMLKWAQTSDGFMAANQDKRLMISNAFTNRLVHRWRSENSAILVGANTVVKDDPRLDNRFWYGVAPQKIVLDPNLKLNTQAQLFQQNDKVLVFNTVREEEVGNISYIRLSEKDIIQKMMDRLHQLQIQSVFVEGGARLLQSFVDAGIWDEARIITNKELLIQEGLPAPLLQNHEELSAINIDSDEIKIYKNRNNQFFHAASGLF